MTTGEMSLGQAISQRGTGSPNRRSHRDDRRAGCALRLIHRSGPAGRPVAGIGSGRGSFTRGHRGVSGIAGPATDCQPSESDPGHRTLASAHSSGPCCCSRPRSSRYWLMSRASLLALEIPCGPPPSAMDPRTRVGGVSGRVATNLQAGAGDHRIEAPPFRWASRDTEARLDHVNLLAVQASSRLDTSCTIGRYGQWRVLRSAISTMT